MPTKQLLIDDLRNFKEEFLPENLDIARTSSEAIELLSRNNYSVVYWDHDLGGEDTSVVVADWLYEQSINGLRHDINLCVIHSSNPAGIHNLLNVFNSSVLCYRSMVVNAKDFFIVG